MKEILKERNEIYGNFATGAKLTTDILSLIESHHAQEAGLILKPTFKIYILYIIHKLVRIAVTPNHIDSWRDIVGYATLIVQTLEKGGLNADK